MGTKLQENCVFCKIIEGSEKAEILYENEHIISILDINPVNFGHALVIPKKHYDDFLSLPEELYSYLLSAVKIVAGAIMSSIEPKPGGFNILSNNGFVAGQRIFHVHFHVIPRYSNDGLKFKPVVKKYTDEELKKYANLIRQKINEPKTQII
ncbi:histidine triad (HIT) family protein [Candidatus Kryptonium thompsonii]|uniref:Histidine triad (HIT) family protein n=1 Tax=Candidatus Kryptonium thompsonii TaxID=1633631 RepID=A0A0P1P6S3_9BACT|nr:HIT family protein [Candidatus Kryptonium thompsoni]CUS80791.1 histidine triad (HIT) family protein [Candidatus Kryptonium thompsoni]CUS81541.1 histidine triad (HIT) family protein [Candidatus Kryptonium thompsoni]CUS82039.1 histidine triad (HIT) family protein [Candidatus Kryptonium thompsoni]CUS84729.1 histidine triad (HIT) family protein [Candidatus Kryptonium thompsoni]CUS88369.1 histidine triad (HIT) family protein [Candidatus Kryptonium thompsoni]